MHLHQLRDKHGGIHMQSFAVSANRSKCIFIRSKGIFVSFFKRKNVETRFLKIEEYIHIINRKKTIDMRTTTTFLSAIIHENTA